MTPYIPNSSPIRRAYRTPDGQQVFQVAGPTGSCWFTANELIQSEKQVRARIATEAGITMVSSKSMTPIIEAVENWTEFETGLLADHPGWHGDLFVLGDGDLIPPSGDTPCAVTFNPNAKFTASGDLHSWRASVAPFVAGQTLPTVALAIALCGPLLRFAPADYLPPQIELYGEPGSGKSTLGLLASSVWSGVLGSSAGGGETWDHTLNAFDDLRRQHCDMFLSQDDASLIAGLPATQTQLRLDAVMKTSGTGMKKRFGDHPGTAVIRVPRMFSANESLEHLAAQKHPDMRDALLDRLMFIRIDKADSEDALSIFDNVPTGYANMETAVAALRQSVSGTFGSAGPDFVRHLAARLQREGTGMTADIRSRCEATCEQLRYEGPRRHKQMLALLTVTLELATEADILDAAWGSPRDAIAALCEFVERAQSSSTAFVSGTAELQHIFRKGRRKNLRPAHPALLPVPRDPDLIWGMYRRDGPTVELWIDPDAMCRVTPAPLRLLKRAKREGILRTHASEANRLTIKAPTAVKRQSFGRVHYFVFSMGSTRRNTRAH